MFDKLVEIPPNAWCDLRNMFKLDWPENHLGYYTIDNFIGWIKLDPNIQYLKVYSLNDDWSDGTVLITDRFQLFIFSLNPSNSRLTTALSLLDWSPGYRISGFLERYRPAVMSVINNKKIGINSDTSTVLYYLPYTKALDFEINVPEDCVLKPLVEADAKIINELWPHRCNGSLFHVKRLIKWNTTVGAYTKDGELVAWSLRVQAGSIGILQVKDEYRRRGLGKLVLKKMAKLLAKIRHDSDGLVIYENTPSRSLFEKLGYESQGKTNFIDTLPTVPFAWHD